MASCRAWGALLVGGILEATIAACAAPPPPAPPPAPSESAEPAASGPPSSEPAPLAWVPDPAGPLPGVGLAATLRAGEKEVYRHYHQMVRFGGGYLSYLAFETGVDLGDPRCAMPGLRAPGCSGIRVARWTAPEDREKWPFVAGASAGSWGPLLAVGQRWDRLSAARNGVYGSRFLELEDKSPLTVDFVDAEGAVHEAFTSKDLSEVEVVETPAGLRLIGIDHERRLAFATVTPASGSPPTVEIKRLLAIGDIEMQERPNSLDARYAARDGARAAYGPWHAILLPASAPGTDPTIALVWVEAEAPRKIERSRRSRHQCARPMIGEFEFGTRRRAGLPSFYGCGQSSRSLSSAAAKKRLHLTKLSLDGAALGDHAFPLAGTYDAAAHPLDLRLEGRTLLVDSRVIDLDHDRIREGKAAILPPFPAIEGPARQTIVTAAFDGASGRGMLIHRALPPATETDREPKLQYFSQEFDALGQPIGAPMRLEREEDALNSAGGPSLLLLEGRWHLGLGGRDGSPSLGYIVEHTKQPFWDRVSGGPELSRSCDPVGYCRPGQHLFLGMAAASHDQAVSTYLLKPPDAIVELVLRPRRQLDEKNFQSLSDFPIAPPYEEDKAPLEALIKEGSFPTDLALGGRPLFHAGKLVTGQDQKPLLLRRRLTGLVELYRDGQWSPLPGWPEHGAASYSLHEVWGDLVLVVAAEQATTATWLVRNKTVELAPGTIQPGPPNQPVDPLLPTGEGGPILPGARFALPFAPGPALPLPADLAPLRPLCPVALPTGPRRLLLACAEPAAPGLLAAVPTLRVVRY